MLATGRTVTVRDFITMAFAEVDITIRWEGTEVNEKGIDAATGKVLVEIDPEYFRPTEVDLLIGDPSKAKEKLGWEASTTLEQMVAEMVATDLETFSKSKYLMEGGHAVTTPNE